MWLELIDNRAGLGGTLLSSLLNNNTARRLFGKWITRGWGRGVQSHRSATARSANLCAGLSRAGLALAECHTQRTTCGVRAMRLAQSTRVSVPQRAGSFLGTIARMQHPDKSLVTRRTATDLLNQCPACIQLGLLTNTSCVTQRACRRHTPLE